MVLVQIGMWDCRSTGNLFTLKRGISAPLAYGVKKIQDLIKRFDLRSHRNNQIVFHSGVTAMFFGHGKYGAHFRVTHCGSNSRGTNY